MITAMTIRERPTTHRMWSYYHYHNKNHTQRVDRFTSEKDKRYIFNLMCLVLAVIATKRNMAGACHIFGKQEILVHIPFQEPDVFKRDENFPSEIFISTSTILPRMTAKLFVV